MIRFVYQTNFYPRVCISAWKDTDECWIRSTVCREHPELDEFKLWQKTKPLPVAEWNHLRTLLQQKSIADPLNGAVPPSEFTGLYGTCWYLQSSIGGKTTSARVDNPLWPADCRSFEKIESQKPIVADFVDTCQLLLKLGDVRVPRMY